MSQKNRYTPQSPKETHGLKKIPLMFRGIFFPEHPNLNPNVPLTLLKSMWLQSAFLLPYAFFIVSAITSKSRWWKRQVLTTAHCRIDPWSTPAPCQVPFVLPKFSRFQSPKFCKVHSHPLPPRDILHGISPARISFAVARDLAQHGPTLVVVIELLSWRSRTIETCANFRHLKDNKKRQTSQKVWVFHPMGTNKSPNKPKGNSQAVWPTPWDANKYSSGKYDRLFV